jgi:Tfp pilus assembly protein PilF
VNTARIDTLRALLEKEPDDVFLNYAVGLEYAVSPSHSAEAEFQFRKVLQTDENYIGAWYQLGKLLESRSHNEALEIYRQGLEKARVKGDNKAVNEFGEAIFLLED